MSDEELHDSTIPEHGTTPEETQRDKEETPKPEGVIRGDSGLDTAQVVIAAFMIIVIGLLAGASACMVPLHGEDRTLFLESDALHQITTFPTALDMLPDAPLSLLSLALSWSLFGGAVGAHALSLVFHLANGVLIYLLCRKLMPAPVRNPMAMAAGMLFVVHPLASESMCLLAGRPSVQGAFFGLLGLVLLLHALGEETHPLRRAASLVAYVFAVGSAPIMLPLPLLYVVMEWWRSGVTALRRNLGFHLIGIGAIVAIVVARIATGAEEWGTYPGGFGETLAAQTVFTVAPFMKFFLPMQHLSAAYPNASMIPFSIFGFMLVLGFGIAAISTIVMRKSVGVVLTWIFLFVTAAPCLVPLDHLLAERNSYFILAGLVLLLVILLDSLRTNPAKQVAGGLVAVLVLACGALMFLRSEAWRYPDTFWEEAAEQTGLPMASMNRARFLTDFAMQAPAKETFSTARDAWRDALKSVSDADRIEALVELGVVEQQLQEGDSALAHLEEALQRDPTMDKAAVFLGAIHAERGRTTGEIEEMRLAMDYFGRAQRRGALSPESYGVFAMALSSVGNVDAAAVMMQALAENAPEDSPQAQAYEEMRAMVEAMVRMDQEAARILQENPDDPEGRLLLASALLQRNRTIAALYLLERAVEANPEHLNTRCTLGLVRGLLGSAEGFISDFADADLGGESAWFALAQRCGSYGQWEVARTYMNAAAERQAISILPEMALVEAALALDQEAMADRFLTEAAANHTDSPEPWLKRCDLALEADDKLEAARMLEEAARRGATDEQLEARSAAGEVDRSRINMPRPTIIQQ